ncbi:MAG: amidohydrolase [Anaerolineae bacterium]|nr:amidohydrolase [Anaerolineae bacterium]MDK1080704.1 amidohydrolase [Anaerolineae bacterium]
MTDFLNKAQELFPYTQTLRRDFHQHPELGFKEIRTAGIVAKELIVLDMEVTTGVAKTGVIGLLEGAQPGPVILIRFDMDALPVTEETGVSFASKNTGTMHACGHDGHTAIGLTVAKILHAQRENLSGTVKFVFQPAEEGTCGEEIGGAEMMIREGVLDSPKPDYALGLHLWNEKPLGWIGAAAGPVMAGAEEFKITVAGVAGHAAIPDNTIDPILAASHIVTALQSITSRNVDPLEAVVVSVTMIHGGDAFNLIPSEVKMEGTIRTFDLSVRENVLRRFDEIVTGIAKSMGCKVSVDLKQLTPAMINADQIAFHVQASARKVLSDSDLDTASQLTMGAEDMAFILEEIPGCYFFVGSANDEKGLNYGHHHPKFNFDEQAMPCAAALMAEAVTRLLKGNS